MDFIDFAAIFITVCLEYCHNDVTMIFLPILLYPFLYFKLCMSCGCGWLWLVVVHAQGIPANFWIELHINKCVSHPIDIINVLARHAL